LRSRRDAISLQEQFQVKLNCQKPDIGHSKTQRMAELNKQARVTMQELLVSSLVQADALAKLSIDNGVITREEFI